MPAIPPPLSLSLLSWHTHRLRTVSPCCLHPCRYIIMEYAPLGSLWQGLRKGRFHNQVGLAKGLAEEQQVE